jgi:hypothetical protein
MIRIGGIYLELDPRLRGDDNGSAGNIFVNTFLMGQPWVYKR